MMTFNDWVQHVRFGSAYEPTVASVRFVEQYRLAKFQEQEQKRINQENLNRELNIQANARAYQ